MPSRLMMPCLEQMCSNNSLLGARTSSVCLCGGIIVCCSLFGLSLPKGVLYEFTIPGRPLAATLFTAAIHEIRHGHDEP